MLYCTGCEQFFDEDDAGEDREQLGEYWGAPAYREYAVCPYCGSDQIEEAHRCKLCGEWIPYSGDDYCEECSDRVFDMYCLMLLDLETKNPGAARKDVLELMNTGFERFWDMKL